MFGMILRNPLTKQQSILNNACCFFINNIQKVLENEDELLPKIPIIYDKYFELKKTYKNESYAQGPLLALFKLKERFYMLRKQNNASKIFLKS